MTKRTFFLYERSKMWQDCVKNTGNLFIPKYQHMKKFKLFCLLLAGFVLLPLHAQMQLPQLPVDKDVRIGK